MNAKYNEDDEVAIRTLLVGRRIVEAEKFSRLDHDLPGIEGKLVLDDGTELLLKGHDSSCCAHYDLSRVAKVDNAITDVKVQRSPTGDGEAGEGVYRIFVFADNEMINVAQFNGTDGTGYYGTGFTLEVVRPKVSGDELVDRIERVLVKRGVVDGGTVQLVLPNEGRTVRDAARSLAEFIEAER